MVTALVSAMGCTVPASVQFMMPSFLAPLNNCIWASTEGVGIEIEIGLLMAAGSLFRCVYINHSPALQQLPVGFGDQSGQQHVL